MQPEPEAAFAGRAAPSTNAVPPARAAATKSKRNFTVPPSPVGLAPAVVFGASMNRGRGRGQGSSIGAGTTLVRVSTLAWASYSDPPTLERERAAIFARSWQYVGRLTQLESPGYFAATVG